VPGADFAGSTGSDRAHVDRLIVDDDEAFSADASARRLAAVVSATDESARDAAVRLLVMSMRERDALGFAAEGGDDWSRLNDAAERARGAYAESLQPQALSRCPFTGDLLEVPFDADGIDGPWWDYHRPCRPEMSVPPTLLSLTGAMKLAADLGDTPFLVAPGPGTPFVLPRLLDVHGVVAVISQISIGEHVAYPITYWATGGSDVELPDDWGTDYHVTDGSEDAGWDSALDDEDSFDFDLAPWFDRGSLRWILPGDTTWTVRTGRAACPYLDLPGVRLLQFVEDGMSWT
jgi:hypothetical protein